MRDIAFRENKEHGFPDFPIQLYHIDESHPKYEMTLHWHRELEIVRVISGTLFLYVNNVKYELSGGDIAFIGSRDMHRAEPHSAVYECIVFDLNMLSRNGSGRISGYVLPLLSENTFTKVLVERQGELWQEVNASFECMKSEGKFYDYDSKYIKKL